MPTSYTQKATERKANTGIAAGKGESSNLKKLLCSTVELTLTTAAGATVRFGRIPSNARISLTSKAYWDDLSSLSATLDIGLGAVNGNITDSSTALVQDLDIATANTTGKNILTDVASAGKRAWDLAGASSDPGGMLEVYGTVMDAANTQTGTITLELDGFID